MCPRIGVWKCAYPKRAPVVSLEVTSVRIKMHNSFPLADTPTTLVAFRQVGAEATCMRNTRACTYTSLPLGQDKENWTYRIFLDSYILKQGNKTKHTQKSCVCCLLKVFLWCHISTCVPISAWLMINKQHILPRAPAFTFIGQKKKPLRYFVELGGLFTSG